MNRYSLIFALMVASGFAIHPAHTGSNSQSDQATSVAQPRKAKDLKGVAPKTPDQGNVKPWKDASDLILAFLKKAPKPEDAQKSLQVLFATVPHPTETHLALEFDHNLDALQDGLQESGYLLDSSWIPWDMRRERDQFEDDLKEKQAADERDDTPGVLLFRRNQRPRQDLVAPSQPNPDADKETDPYSNGLAVILFSEKPTEGIAYSQAETALKILEQCNIQGWSSTFKSIPDAKSRPKSVLKILGPSFSGSFASLVPVAKALYQGNPAGKVLIRSGSVSSRKDASSAAENISKELNGTPVDIGSAAHDSRDAFNAALEFLTRLGLKPNEVAQLSEGESLFGYNWRSPEGTSKKVLSSLPTSASPWSISFPRDISSLRAGYQEEGIFDAGSGVKPWKRFLNLKNDSESEGDSIRSFGGTTTTESQEAVLFGISEFLKSHAIRAAIIVATNEEDRLFLTQFLHANNADVRVIIVGSTRIFMRGSTSQFRGDLVVTPFPMLPRLYDWTDANAPHAPHVFADEASQGTFFAAVDLFQGQDANRYPWYPEYSAPLFEHSDAHAQFPPVYLAALGGPSTWPVSEGADGTQNSQFTRVEKSEIASGTTAALPFELFAHNFDFKRQPPNAKNKPSLHIALQWKLLAFVVLIFVALHCAAIVYANVVSRENFASFQPTDSGRYWLFKVTIPGAMAGCAFHVLAWGIEIPASASPDCPVYWRLVEIFALLAPLAIAVCAWTRALRAFNLKKNGWMALPFISIALSGFFSLRVFSSNPFAGHSVSAMLNTYREMHWESGLSLLPSFLLLLMAIAVWSSQAGNGAAVLNELSPLPEFAENLRISGCRADQIKDTARPIPVRGAVMRLYVTWGIPAAVLLIAHFCYPPFLNITTLEPRSITFLVRSGMAIVAAAILFDLLQFLFLWEDLHSLLHALDRTNFKRGFVPLDTFNWKGLWTFTGVSFHSRRAIHTAMIDCLEELSGIDQFSALKSDYRVVNELRIKYNKKCDLGVADFKTFMDDNRSFKAAIRDAACNLAVWREKNGDGSPSSPDANFEALQRAVRSTSNQSRFADEAEEVARLPRDIQLVDQFLCLIYIAFIQGVIARLHTLLISIAMGFSLLTLSLVIYPFEPLTPLLVTGGGLLAFFAFALFKVFSQMDTDPILARIVNGDDRKLQAGFYAKFAEVMALPVLTAASSLLPGGAGRLIDLLQELMSHAGG